MFVVALEMLLCSTQAIVCCYHMVTCSLIIATPLDWHGIHIGIIVWLHKDVVTNEIYAWVWLKDFILRGEMYYMFQHRSPKKVGKLYVNQMPVAESQFKVEVVENYLVKAVWPD